MRTRSSCSRQHKYKKHAPKSLWTRAQQQCTENYKVTGRRARGFIVASCVSTHGTAEKGTRRIEPNASYRHSKTYYYRAHVSLSLSASAPRRSLFLSVLAFVICLLVSLKALVPKPPPPRNRKLSAPRSASPSLTRRA